MSSGQKYFLIVSTDHFYCVPKKDLIVADADVPISTSVDIDFKYGTKTFRGSIVKISSYGASFPEKARSLERNNKVWRSKLTEPVMKSVFSSTCCWIKSKTKEISLSSSSSDSEESSSSDSTSDSSSD